MKLLLAALALTVLTLYLHRQKAPALRLADRLALALAYLLPAGLLLLALADAPPVADRFRMALTGLGIRGDAFRVTIGSDPAVHDIWVKGFGESHGGTAPHLGELVYDPAGTIGGATSKVALEVPVTVPNGMLVRHSRGEGLEPLAAVRLEAGDVVRVGTAEWRVRFDKRWLGPARELLVSASGAEVEIPPRRGQLPFLGLQIPIPIWRPFSVTQRTYPLSLIMGQPASDTLRSFLYRKPRGGLWLARLEEPVVLLRQGQEVAFDTRAELAPGTRIHAVGLPRPLAGIESGGLRDRRSYRVMPGRRSVMLILDTPEIHALTSKDIRQLTEAKDTADGRPVGVHLAMGSWRITDRYLHFAHASDQVAGEAFGTLDLPLEWGPHFFGVRRFELISPYGQQQVEEGKPFWFGRKHLAAVQIDLLSPPLVLGYLALLFALLKAIAADLARLSRGQLLFAGALEVLVSVRVLLGYRVWAVPPFKAEAFELALVAWALLPWAFLAASLPPLEYLDRKEITARLPAVAGCGFAIAWCARLGGGGLRTWLWVLVVLAALLLPVIRSETLWANLASGLKRRWTHLAGGLKRRWPALAGGLSKWRWRPGGDGLWIAAWCSCGLLLGLIRLVLLFFGFRESLSFGNTRFSLSLIHVPLALLLEAGYLVWLWHTLCRRSRLQRWDLAPAVVLVLGTWLVPALMVSDLGLALLHLPVFLFALTTVTHAARSLFGSYGRRSWGLWAPATALLLCVLLLCIPVGAKLLLIIPLPAEWREQLSSERNYLRLLAFGDPDQLREIGGRTSEELSVMSTVMRVYTHGERALFGRGYFGSEISPHIRTTALREHVPAVFVAGEWGLAGALGLILVYLLCALFGFSLMPCRSWYQDEFGFGYALHSLWSTLGGLGALTLAGPSVYMILANYGVVLFTGRNAYLLGLDSTADLLEALMLVLLFAQGAAALRDQRL